MNFKRKRTVLLQNGDTVRNQVRHLLILLSFLLLSFPVIGQETGVLYQYETSSGIQWKTFGDGKVQPKYKGDIKNGKPNGQGTLTLPNGFKYVGEWRDGLINGQGTSTYPNGSKYVGEWKDGHRSGQGTSTYPNGSKYEGEWRDGLINGQGTLTYHNGSKYVGEWKDGKKNGQGTVTNSDGEKYVGEFNHAKLKRKQKYLNNESRMLTNKCVNSHLNNCTLTNYKRHPVFSDFY